MFYCKVIGQNVISGIVSVGYGSDLVGIVFCFITVLVTEHIYLSLVRNAKHTFNTNVGFKDLKLPTNLKQ